MFNVYIKFAKKLLWRLYQLIKWLPISVSGELMHERFIEQNRQNNDNYIQEGFSASYKMCLNWNFEVATKDLLSKGSISDQNKIFKFISHIKVFKNISK